MSRLPRKNELVLATEWFDGSSKDAWAVGPLDGAQDTGKQVLFSLRDGAGNLKKGIRYRRVKLISKERAAWLIANKDKINASTRSAWGWSKLFMKRKVVEYVGALGVAGYIGDEVAWDVDIKHVPRLPRGRYRLAIIYFDEETTNAAQRPLQKPTGS